MQQRFHIFTQHHFNGWYTAQVLTHPDYAAYAPTLKQAREELQEVLARELALKRLVSNESDTFFETLNQHALRVDLNAVQNERLVRVPMRFTLFERPLKEKDLFEIWIPRLNKSFRIFDKENIIPWSEEIVRGYFHLRPVESLLAYQYERNERIEPLEVVYHGAGRYKVKKEKDDLDELFSLFEPKNPLLEVGVNLTQEASEGRLQRAQFREKEMQQLISVLSGHQQRSLLLVGNSGVGKTALVHELAARIAAKSVPERLLDTKIWYVTGSRIIAGMKYLGEWQERCLRIIEEVRSEQGILYVDGILEIMMAGSLRSGLNVAQMLLPFLQKDDIVVIAEATPDALAMAEQLNAPFVQTFRRFPVPAFSSQDSFAILERSAHRLGKENKAIFTREAIQRALDILARFGDANALPGSGIRLIEQMAHLYPPGEQKRKLHPPDAIKAFARSSGFPENLIDPEQKLDLPKVKQFFLDRIVGQKHPVQLLTNLIMLIKASLNDPLKPLGSFLFMGPTGVGKTESVLALAEYLFGDRKRLLRLDMSEYSSPGSSMRLVGGVDGEGDLTRKIREQPFSIVLLDEIEKADSSVFDLLLQVLGEGRLTDTTGSTVHFTHTIIIMTSNLGAEQKAPPGFAERTVKAVESHYREAAEKFFRPEFINRIDFLVPFHSLDQDALRKIAKMMLDKAIQREGFQRRQISIRYEDNLLDHLVSLGYQPRYGARPMKRAIEQSVLVPLSRRLIRRQEAQAEVFELYLEDDNLSILSDRGGSSPIPLPLKNVQLQHDNLWERYLGDIRRRIQSWEEAVSYKELRLAQSPLFTRFQEQIQAVEQLEWVSQRTPSKLAPEKQQELREQAFLFDAARLDLEWEFACYAWKQKAPPSKYTLHIHSPTLHPQALRLMLRLAEAYQQFAQSIGLEVQLSEESERITIDLQGPLATLFRLELGHHRLQLEEQHYAVLVSESPQVNKEESGEEDEPLRIITEDPPLLFDPLSGLEVRASLPELPKHMRTFLLTRINA
ncbi:MAG: ATP-dependent Clp protease ATP-binding subunit [Myxococcales bacterium]|nr:ATP-dependent Clp protease ATP-binding subunit [Myxococcales bacterium]